MSDTMRAMQIQQTLGGLGTDGEAVVLGIEPEIETFDLEDANEAFGRMMSNDVRFRAVLEP